MTARAPSPDDADSEDLRKKFRIAAWQDIKAGQVQPLKSYLARFPGDDAALKREYSSMMASLHHALEAASCDPETEVLEPGAEFARLADPDLGRRLGPWWLLRELGHGGQGTVYLAEDSRLRRKAAVKILNSTGLVGAALDRFKREASVAARLDHPGICAVYDVGF